jgi:hypothetical protein
VFRYEGIFGAQQRMKHMILHVFASDDIQRKRSETRLGRLETGDWMSTGFQETRICIFIFPGFQDHSVSGAGDSPFTPLEPRSDPCWWGWRGIKIRWKSPKRLHEQQPPWRSNSHLQVTVVSRVQKLISDVTKSHISQGWICLFSPRWSHHKAEPRWAFPAGMWNSETNLILSCATKPPIIHEAERSGLDPTLNEVREIDFRRTMRCLIGR